MCSVLMLISFHAVALHAVWAGTLCDDELRLPTARALFSATPLGSDRILIAGGLGRDAALADAFVLDLRNDLQDDQRPSISPPIPLAGRLLPARAMHTSIPLGDGGALLVGGTAPGFEVFDAQQDGGGFRIAGFLPGGMRVFVTATVLADGRVLITGGRSAAHQDVRSTEVLDLRGDESPGDEFPRAEQGPDLLESRSSHTATLLSDGRVLVVGGPNRASTELFEPVLNRFVAGPELMHARDDHRATRLADGCVLITGGQDGRGRSRATAELFDPETDTLEPVGDLNHARSDHAQVLAADGSVWILGGEDDDGTDKDSILRSVERFDPATRRFELRESMSVARDDHCAVLLSGDRIVVIGGYGDGDVVLDSIEVIETR